MSLIIYSKKLRYCISLLHQTCFKYYVYNIYYPELIKSLLSVFIALYLMNLIDDLNEN